MLVAIALIFASPLPSVLGLGQGIAALRARGDHMILATLGLVLCGLNVGVFIGLFSFSCHCRFEDPRLAAALWAASSLRRPEGGG